VTLSPGRPQTVEGRSSGTPAWLHLHTVSTPSAPDRDTDGVHSRCQNKEGVAMTTRNRIITLAVASLLLVGTAVAAFAGVQLQQRQEEQERLRVEQPDDDAEVTPLRAREEQREQRRLHDPEDGVDPLQQQEREQRRLHDPEDCADPLQQQQREQLRIHTPENDASYGPEARMRDGGLGLNQHDGAHRRPHWREATGG
jgi:hypothetical protein